VLLTAAHVVKAHRPSDLTVSIDQDKVARGLEVLRIDLHPRLDVAALRISENTIFDPFSKVSAQVSFGDEVAAFGYPEDTEPSGVVPVPRLFRGHIQRIFDHQSEFGFRYTAAELSFPAPAGLSGGPVALKDHPTEVIGVVTESKLATTFLQSIAEFSNEKERFSERIHSTIEYGLAALLTLQDNWLRRVLNDA
jgi:hypothetical protein